MNYVTVNYGWYNLPVFQPYMEINKASLEISAENAFWVSGASVSGLHHHDIEITLQHGYCPVNLLQFFRTPFVKNTSGWLFL